MELAFTNNLQSKFLVKVIWHTPKAMQSRVEMNDDYIALDCALQVCCLTGIEAWLHYEKKSKQGKEVNTIMELNIQTPKPNGNSNGHMPITEKSRSIKTDFFHDGHISIFDPN